MTIPLPAPRFNPDPALGAPQVVGLETWLWVDTLTSSDLSTTVCVPDPAYACVRLVATFVDAGFDMGDGSPERFCRGAGRPYDASAADARATEGDHCSHVYDRADAGGSVRDVVATSFWHVTWSCSYDADLVGGLEASCGRGDLGIIGRTATAVPLDVLDLQARARS
jgi:hypothetical protein